MLSPPSEPEESAPGVRADVSLVARGFSSSRTQARHAIEAGHVRADGVAVSKPSQLLNENATIEFAPEHAYVSRGALKLEAALDSFGFPPKGRICLDLGASTGGFTQLLLEHGAVRVYAVDVGHGQLNSLLSNDPRVIAIEGVNARELSRANLSDSIDAVVADVSFISLRLALPPALRLARSGSWLVALVKPQFEVGQSRVGKHGIVRDSGMRLSTVQNIMEWLTSLGWTVQAHIESPIRGGSGNVEFPFGARRH